MPGVTASGGGLQPHPTAVLPARCAMCWGCALIWCGRDAALPWGRRRGEVPVVHLSCTMQCPHVHPSCTLPWTALCASLLHPAITLHASLLHCAICALQPPRSYPVSTWYTSPVSSSTAGGCAPTASLFLWDPHQETAIGASLPGAGMPCVGLRPWGFGSKCSRYHLSPSATTLPCRHPVSMHSQQMSFLNGFCPHRLSGWDVIRVVPLGCPLGHSLGHP